MKMTPAKVVKVMGVVSMIAGTGALIVGGIMLMKALSSADWPTVLGRITSSKLASREETGSSSAGSTTTVYYADVRYTYIVEEKTYGGKKVSFDEVSSNNPVYAREVVNSYPAGKEVSVHYNPDKPGDTVLEAGAEWTSYLLPGMGIVFLAVGALFCFKLAPLVSRRLGPAYGGIGHQHSN